MALLADSYHQPGDNWPWSQRDQRSTARRPKSGKSVKKPSTFKSSIKNDWSRSTEGAQAGSESLRTV
jgi:hypothetical protein